VVVLNPKGQVLREIQLHGSKPSNLCFGGEDGCTVYVTLADQGNVETFRVDVPGREWVLHQRTQKGGWD
jgi:gluconolactonase